MNYANSNKYLLLLSSFFFRQHRIIYLLVLALLWVVLSAKVTMSNPNRVCFTPEPGDSNSFGLSVAINDKYLAIGDPGANHVIIYTRDNSGQWVRTKKIFPPKNSTPYKYNSGFGRNLQLDGDVLVISAITYQETRDVTNPEDFQQRTILTSIFYGRYLIKLDSETETKAIDLPVEKKPGFVKFNLLSEGKIKSITLPDRGEDRFGESFALHNNLLLVGSPSDYEERGAWLFDINHLDNEPLKITYPDVDIGQSVAISEQFLALGEDGIPRYRPFTFTNQDPQKTLIRNIRSGSTTIIDGVGELSLSGNILARMLPRSADREQTSLLEVFRLDDNATPRLITKHEYYLSRAWVQNAFLVTVESNYNDEIFKVCVESIS